ncbi:terminase TerL endonuclease subunit [Companilactobacillus bobalius]|uniref:Phage terminase, large subunit n=2 Tax=Companilactobacillus bobalius TaxID=2801451 RepID=A0A0R1KRB1_9LACO|nr:terminase TerL endonuclease subunit [Companilactobacillus bobalius]GEO58482.1 terminase [Companilactobacillus paralimentarius]KAE9557570.1 hypothetical protein ATN92_15570 [Companilactobacillus bobalius]KAE9563716.1 hypothetical protein ATN92_03020 [Companilactobacillus bobalius]KRK83460.1 phage terminase, large subunit [Companilactobacillus bobalius DSM 19674]OVE96543.1 putative terminase large subunit [Companilactobacillus bobalius]
MTISKVKYHPAIDEYMNGVLSGKIVACKEQIQLMHFLIDKLADLHAVLRTDLIDAALENIEKHFVWKLLPWEKFILAFVHGAFYDDGSLMFDEFLVLLGRGGGKTGFMSVEEWLLASKQGIRNYDVDIVATSEEQATTSFNEIWDLLDSNPRKYKKYFQWTKKLIKYKKTNSKIKYRTSNANTKDGGRPGAVFFDEIHAYKDEETINVFTSGLGKKPYPRRFYMTTDGYNREGFLDNLKDESEMVLAGERPKRRMFPFICKLDSPDEWEDETMWEKANPSLIYFPTLKQEMESEFEKAHDRDQARIEFMTKRMNIPASKAQSPVASWDNIKATNQTTPDLRGRSCIVGIDFSDTMDFCGIGLLFKIGNKYYWKHHSLINYKALEHRKYKVPLDVAKEKGFIKIIDDETNRPKYVVDWILEQAKYYDIKDIAADTFRRNYLQQEFTNNGFGELLAARTGIKTHTDLENTIDDLFAYHNIVYVDDDFMMRWYTNNVYKDRDSRGNIEYKKIEPKLRKTDGFFAFLNAFQFRDKLDVPVATYHRTLRTHTY